jgi:Domain of unknown function (DUF4185)
VIKIRSRSKKRSRAMKGKNRGPRVGIRWIALLLALWLTSCAPQPLVTVRELPAFNRLFDREEGWTGADGAYSVALGEDRTLWLFGDTWIGKIRDGRHVDASLINNSVAVQKGTDPATATVRFYYRHANDGRPESFIRPTDGKCWFWMYDGILAPDGLYLFLIELERAEPSGFRLVGTWLAQIPNPTDAPTDWHIRLKRIPWARFSPSGDLFFGSAILEDGGFYYIFGIDEVVRNGWHDKFMIVARVPKGHLWDLDQWRFHGDGKWKPDLGSLTRLCGEMANEYSVSYLERLGQYVAVYTEEGISDFTVARKAPTPYGPWSSPIRLYTCPEAAWGPSIICYAAKGHPSLSSRPDVLIVSYVANSTDFWQMASDAKLYRPRFFQVEFSAW